MTAAVLAAAMSADFVRPLAEAAAEFVPGLCERKIVQASVGCVRWTQRKMESIAARAVVVAEKLEQQRKMADADIDTWQKKKGRNAMYLAELRQLRATCDGGACSPLTWRGRRFVNSGEIERQIETLQHDLSEIQTTVGRLQKAAADLTTQIVTAAGVRSRAIGEITMLRSHITLAEGLTLAMDLQAALEQVSLFTADADQKLTRIEKEIESGPPRIGDDIETKK
jgi:hypothetical protein